MAFKKKINTFLFLFYSSVLILLLVIIFRSNSGTSAEENITLKPIVIKLNQYGFNDNILVVKKESVKLNETLSGILSKYNLSANEIDNILYNSNTNLDYRKIIAGNNYYTYLSNDSLSKLNYFVYEKDPINYVVFNLTDSVEVYSGQKEVKTERKSVTGIINHSLYIAMLNNEASPELVMELSEVFAWEIDFYRIQKGDYFKVIYDEEYVDKKPIGIKKIIGAYFNHNGEDFYAIGFKQNEKDQYFDENGKSLRKAFLKAPVKFSRISSRYSLRRYHPVEHRMKAHLGTDYAAPIGTPILSTGDGIVIAATYSRFNGNYVKIRHNSVYSTQYLHMSKFAKGIHKGVRVKQGQVIGYVGMTGEATGPHVCYRFWKNGSQVNPLKQKIPSSHPVKPELLEAYNKKKAEVLSELDSLKLSFQNITDLTSVQN
jgi:murein DD-endopeptidase MepM/ murein hydrolase activator NlpD